MSATDRCEYSDLHPWECDHCGPAPAPSLTLAELTVVAVRNVNQISVRPYLRPVQHVVHTTEILERADNLLEYVLELCDWTRRGEPYQVQQRNPDGTHTFITLRHVTTAAPLLQQLAAALSTSGAEDGGGAHAFESKSPARDDAIATLMTIEADAYAWVADLDNVKEAKAHELYATAAAVVRHLGSLAPSRTCSRKHGRRDKDTKDWCCTGHHIEADIRTWHTQARVTTGWDAPAWKPANTCPLCGTKGSLRVRLEEHSGMCVKCRETWTPESIGLLADHIRSENRDPFFTPEVESDTPVKEERLA